MPSTIPCPDAATLRALVLGELDRGRAVAVEAHLEQCSACRALVRREDWGDAAGFGSAATEVSLRDSDEVAFVERIERFASVGTDADLRGETPLHVRTGQDSRDTAVPPDDLPVCVHGYRLEGEIDKGGMGRVVRVRDEDFERPLAMKVLLARGGDHEARFLREARMTGLLQHPGIPPVHALGRLADGRPYFVMKLIQGRSLAELLRARPSPDADLPRWLGIFEHVCHTVGYAHARGVIHRDLKPLNVMIGAFGEVQVMDWGLAKLLGAAEPEPVEKQGTVFGLRQAVATAEATAAQTVMGTPPYMAPEQARGEVDTLDLRADVFGLGAILCEILTGRPPYTGPNSLDQAAGR
jgi:serine/threonine protein kinase